MSFGKLINIVDFSVENVNGHHIKLQEQEYKYKKSYVIKKNEW